MRSEGISRAEPTIRRRRLRLAGATTPYLVWILLLFLAPIMLLLVASLWTQSGVHLDRALTLENYRRIGNPDSPELRILARSVATAAVTSGIALLLAYPLAYFVAKGVRSPRAKTLLLLPILLPFLVSPLVVGIAWRGVLGTRGLVNTGLTAAGVVDAPLDFLLFSRFSVIVALVYSYSLWLFFTVWLNLEAVDDGLMAAARDLGADGRQVLVHIVLPLSLPGVATGLVLTFVPVVGTVLEPELLGGTGGRLIGNSIRGWYLEGLDWPFGAALSATLMAVTLALLALGASVLLRRARLLVGRHGS